MQSNHLAAGPLQVLAALCVNIEGTREMIDTKLAQPGSRPVRYELIDRYGQVDGVYDTAEEAAFFASKFWPGEEQDPDRTGKGWDIEVVR